MTRYDTTTSCQLANTRNGEILVELFHLGHASGFGGPGEVVGEI
jgi:hypothetical protein